MLTIRTTKTASGATAVQVVKRANRQTIVLKHIGSAQNKKRLEELLALARSYIVKENLMRPLFPDMFNPEDQLVSMSNIRVTDEYYHQFAYEFFAFFYVYNGFSILGNKLLQDFAIIRIIEPASKVRSLALLKEYFAITHGYEKLYKTLRKIRGQKADIEKAAVSFAKITSPLISPWSFMMSLLCILKLSRRTRKNSDEQVSQKTTGRSSRKF
jgi:hypothetical protein